MSIPFTWRMMTTQISCVWYDS